MAEKSKDVVLKVAGISKRFGGLQALSDVGITIERGQVYGLIGPNGAGKTTFFNVITGFDKPSSAKKLFGGPSPAEAAKWSFDGRTLGNTAASKVARAGMVRTFQLTKALSLLTVLENMKLGAPKQKGEKFWASFVPALWRGQEEANEEKARGLLTRFKLDAKEKDFAASLSGGQRKLLEMARALMSDPNLVMLDEPMAGVNPALTQSLLDHILDLKDLGVTVLFVEHDMHMVRHIADWVVVMAEGKVVAEGPPDTVMEDQAVIDAYLGSHQDVDLGVVTGRVAGEIDESAKELLAEIKEDEAAAIADAEEENK